MACGPATLLFAALWLSGCATTPPPTVSAQPGHESAAQGALANDILFRAIGLVGTPYQWGGNTPEGGFDCSGLIGFVYRDVAGLTLPRTTRELLAMPAKAITRDQLSAGDLLFFATGNSRSVNHAGIYVGEGRFVHAPSKGGTVRLDYLADRYWNRAYLDARRLI
ncbi:MAG: C40 family peptidase [Gammaproteobacteria bacterium]|nr:C40 family peptidase [Gammaproteobacteria bacterium]